MQIRFIKQVVFKDRDGTVLLTYNPGDMERATAKHTNYFVTPMGGIYFDEAEEIV